MKKEAKEERESHDKQEVNRRNTRERNKGHGSNIKPIMVSADALKDMFQSQPKYGYGRAKRRNRKKRRATMGPLWTEKGSSEMIRNAVMCIR